MFSFSTSWNAKRHTDAKDLIDEIKCLGFNSLELNFTLGEALVERAVILQKKGLIDVASLHNYCPMPKGLTVDEASPDLFSLSSLNEEERYTGISQTKLTIDYAYKLGARAVVIHMGRVDMGYSGKDLKEAYLKDKSHNNEYETLKSGMIKERMHKSPQYLKKAIESLELLSKYAKGFGISLGIETRYYFDEIPSYEEMETILDRFKNSSVFYWHDVGHAQVQENMGLARHIDYLHSYGDRMLGVHLHDVKGLQDHKAPLTGDVDFEMLTPFLHKDIIKVVEVHSHATVDEIIRGVKYLEGLWTWTKKICITTKK